MMIDDEFQIAYTNQLIPSYLNSVLPDTEFFRKVLAYLNAWEFLVFKRVLQPIQLFICKRCATTPLSRSVTLKKTNSARQFHS